MNVKVNSLCFIAVLPFLSACAGKLVIYDAKGDEAKGVPFRTAEVYIKTGTNTKLAKGGKCEPTLFHEPVMLPTGALYFAEAKTAQFAKTSFHIKYGENGAVSEIGLDSEPSAAETLKAGNELMKTLLPIFGVAGVAAAAGGGAEGAGGAAGRAVESACDAGESGVQFVRLDDFMKPKLPSQSPVRKQ